MNSLEKEVHDFEVSQITKMREKIERLELVIKSLEKEFDIITERYANVNSNLVYGTTKEVVTNMAKELITDELMIEGAERAFYHRAANFSKILVLKELKKATLSKVVDEVINKIDYADLAKKAQKDAEDKISRLKYTVKAGQ